MRGEQAAMWLCVCSALNLRNACGMMDMTDASACRKRFVFVNLDACMASQGVTLTVLEQLKASSPQSLLQTQPPRSWTIFCSAVAVRHVSGPYLSGPARAGQAAKWVIRPTQELYGDLYTEKNVALSGIHTHSGPGGYLQYILYIITSLGFVRESFDVLVAGIVQVTSPCPIPWQAICSHGVNACPA